MFRLDCSSFRLSGLVAGVGLATLATGCASQDDFRDFDYVSASDRTAYPSSVYADNDRDRYTPEYRTARRSYVGINGARVAHRAYSDHRAERLDGDCERHVFLERGETLSDIAEYCDVPVAALIDANPDIRNPRYVSIGERLRVPAVSGSVYQGSYRYAYRDANYTGEYVAAGALERYEDTQAYSIRRGDTLGEIAYRFDVPLQTIYRLNPRVNPRSLNIGQRIILPDYARIDPRQRERRDYVHYPDAPPRISITPARGPLDGDIRVIGDNFRQGEQVTVFFGDREDNLTKLKIIETDGDGRINEIVRLPDSYGHDEAYFAMRSQNYDDYIMSEAYAVEAAERRARKIAANQASGRAHVVRDGQSMAWIASRYGVPMGELRALNPQVDFAELRVGQRLALPSDARIEARSTSAMSANPIISSVQRSVYYGDEITLVAEGFPQNTPVVIYGGENRNSLRKSAEVRSGPQGRFTVDVALPQTFNSETAVFVAAIEDGPRTIFSEKIRILTPERDVDYDVRARTGVAPARTPEELNRGIANDGSRGGFFSRFRRGEDYPVSRTPNAVGGVDSAGNSAIVGILTDEGANCPALRDDAGNLFTVLGDLEGFDDGDRVLVRGSLRADDRICGQAETIHLYEIESAPW